MLSYPLVDGPFQTDEIFQKHFADYLTEEMWFGPIQNSMLKLKDEIKIALVGPCSSGKSTLRKELLAAGYRNVKMPTQEHSYVKDMWQRITNPDLLIYLDVDYPTTLIRRPHIDLGSQRVDVQNDRLSHAKEHAHFYIDTSPLTPNEVGQQVLQFLKAHTLT